MELVLYGVGAIGSLVTHYLIKAGNDVTVVAGSTAEVLKKEGLVIEHYLQGHKITVDRPNVKFSMVFKILPDTGRAERRL